MLAAIAGAVGEAMAEGPPVAAQIVDAVGRRRVPLVDGVQRHEDDPNGAAHLDFVLAHRPHTCVRLASRERTSIVAVLMNAMLAEHHALSRALNEAVGALTHAARLARKVGVPRFVAHAVPWPLRAPANGRDAAPTGDGRRPFVPAFHAGFTLMPRPAA